MVTVKLYGGLGNQMYQYAAGVALARKLRSKLHLDTAWFEQIKGNADVTQRIYELDGFGIAPAPLSVLDKINLRLNPPKLFSESGLGFNKDFEELNGNVYLDGYWQSYKYFEEYRQAILEAFSFPETISRSNLRLLTQIKKLNSVSIHVRRGDYNTKRGRSYHGLIGKSYYYKALEDLSKKVKHPVVFIFSDEIDWCKKNLTFDYPLEFIDSNSTNAGVEDMRLMSSCKHNIIANSSFSWWAAWLNKNVEKTIYAPTAWFAGEEHNIDDRLPTQWIRI